MKKIYGIKECFMSGDVAAQTGKLFGDLWHKLDGDQYEESVGLFARRFEANGFDLGWFQGKACLDAGCGGGRYTVAMGRLGAREAVGVDVSEAGIADARQRATGEANVRFQVASVLDLPLEDDSFDFVCSSGVLHHTTDLDKGLDEITRVLRPGGKLYLLLYGSGGLRWAASGALRPIAQDLGYDFMDAAIAGSGLPANNRRNFLDDFFVPIVTFIDWETLHGKLSARGFGTIERWMKGRFDHEASPLLQREEVEKMVRIFAAAKSKAESADAHVLGLAEKGLQEAESYLSRIDELIAAHDEGRIGADELEREVIGEGNHRVLADKS